MNRGRGHDAHGGHGVGGGEEDAAPKGLQTNVDVTAILAEMQVMHAEMNAMHLASAGATIGVTPCSY
jgi:hypothetical protein